MMMPRNVRCRRYTYINLHALGVPNVLCAWVRPHVRFLLHVVPESWTPVALPMLSCQGGDVERVVGFFQIPAEHRGLQSKTAQHMPPILQ